MAVVALGLIYPTMSVTLSLSLGLNISCILLLFTWLEITFNVSSFFGLLTVQSCYVWLQINCMSRFLQNLTFWKTFWKMKSFNSEDFMVCPSSRHLTWLRCNSCGKTISQVFGWSFWCSWPAACWGPAPTTPSPSPSAPCWLCSSALSCSPLCDTAISTLH